MGRAQYIACALLMLCPLALSRHDDDFAFDNSEEFQVELTANHSEIAKNGLRRLWGVPDTSAYVGHLFRMEIPKEAFSGKVLAYKVRSDDGRRTPSWLAVDSRHGLISGVPQKQDIGPHTFTVTAHGNTHGLTATDSFTIEVKKAQEKPQSKYGSCMGDESRLILAILIDGSFHKISSKQRIRALMQLASFMALDGEEFWMAPYKAEPRSETILSGTGSSQRRHSDATTAIYLNVGCGNKLWNHHKVLVAGLREQSRDGTVAHVVRLPVIGWRLVAVQPAPRIKRQSPQLDGSGDGFDAEYDEEDDADAEYSGYDDIDDEDSIDYTNNDGLTDPVDPLTPASHPHRHHHGESPANLAPVTPGAPHTTTETFQTESAAPLPTPTLPVPIPSTPANTLPPSPTPTTEPLTEEAPPATEDTTPESATSNMYTLEDHKVTITEISASPSETSKSNFSIAPTEDIAPRRINFDSFAPIVVPETTTSEPELQTVIIRASNEVPPMTSTEREASVTSPSSSPPLEVTTQPTTPVVPTTTASTTSAPTSTLATTPTTQATTTPTVPTTTSLPETTLQEVTKQETNPTEGRSTISGQTTETVNVVAWTMPVNQPPTLKHHMKKLATIAGKAFRYIIPADLFTDPEDGSNLTFTMYEAENVPLSKNSWVQFIPSAREVYGLPLEAHVSRWNFIVEAQDSEGRVARGPLDITVQQHKSGRTINHQFIMEFKLNKEYNYAIDWQIRALEGIVNLFRDTDMDHLTVLNTTQNGDMCQFVWTNDTLPKDPACPMDDIKRLMKILESETQPGSPSAGLARAMQPELKVSSVRWRGAGRCAHAHAPAARPPAPHNTYPPVTRNQVDHLTATVGHLLVYKVPEDTFFDPEDGDTRHLKLSLRYSDRTELPVGHWLQFDAKNQEFYGLPAPSDEGSVPYQLIAEDSSKKSAYDSLIVEVAKAPAIRPTVEFQMTMDYPFPKLAYDATNKRKVVEKLAALFGQKETDNIRIQSITNNPTTIIWYNTSLPMDRCPKREIEELRQMIIVDEKGPAGSALKETVDHVFDKDMKVMSIRLIPLGLCAEQHTKYKLKLPKTTTHVKPETPIDTNSGPPTHVDSGPPIHINSGLPININSVPPIHINSGLPIDTNSGLPIDINSGPPTHINSGPPIHINSGSPNLQNSKASNAADHSYLVTFIIPAIVVVCMILLAGIVACVLYRRRRTGKMSVGDEEERQAFRSKGIPVIFQDELEERGDTEPVHKSPVIMREEKPPLLPPAPDYRGTAAEDAPYRPPPPFAATRTPPRPKATPTYRKPPPYVPP